MLVLPAIYFVFLIQTLTASKMTLEKFKERIINAEFRSTNGGTIYKFIAGTTLQVNGLMENSSHYNVIEDNEGDLILQHGGMVPNKLNEPLVITINEGKPFSFSVIGKLSKDFLGTWVEISPYEL